MTSFVLTQSATIMCPHGGTVTMIPSQFQVMADGSPVLVLSDTGTVAGCPFQIPTPGGPKPQPCVTVRWMVSIARWTIGGTPVLNRDAVGLCYSAEQIPQGPPNIVVTQMKVKA